MRQIHHRVPRTSAESKEHLKTQHVAVPCHAAGQVAHGERRVVEEVPGRGGGRWHIRSGEGDREGLFDLFVAGLMVIDGSGLVLGRRGAAGLGYDCEEGREEEVVKIHIECWLECLQVTDSGCFEIFIGHFIRLVCVILIADG